MCRILSEDTRRALDDAGAAATSGDKQKIRHYTAVAQIKTDMDLIKYSSKKRTEMSETDKRYIAAREACIREAAKADLMIRVTICGMVIVLMAISGFIINILSGANW